MSQLITTGLKPKHLIANASDGTTFYLVTYERSNQVYVTKSVDGTHWDAEIYLNKGNDPYLHFHNDHVYLFFTYNSTVLYRLWHINQTPVYMKPPGLLTDSGTMRGETAGFSCSDFYVSLQSYADNEPVIGSNMFSMSNDLPTPPTSYRRWRVDQLEFDIPTTLMGVGILGYNVYRIAPGNPGTVTKVNADLIPPASSGLTRYTGTLDTSCWYTVTAAIYPSYNNTPYLESQRTSTAYINPNEIWCGEVINAFGYDTSNNMDPFSFTNYIANNSTTLDTGVLMGYDLANTTSTFYDSSGGVIG